MAQQLSMEEYIELQRQEILGPDNRWYAAEHGIPPDDQNALAWYYIEHGGADSFAQRHGQK